MDIIYERHNFVKTRPSCEKNPDHMQFYLLYKIIKKISGSEENKPPLILTAHCAVEKSVTI